ncbi:MAG: tetratricopeptide repeat protein [Polyangiaceae bacterium]
MKTKPEWFRRTTWSDADLAAFLERNRRSRGDRSKAQYVRVQAHTLLETGVPELIQGALDLLVDHYFPLYSAAFDSSSAFCCAGQCCEALGLHDEAIAYYRRALVREREARVPKTSAEFLYAKLAVELACYDLVDEALSAIDQTDGSPFPWHAYIANGARAVALHAKGDREAARTLAQAALSSASVQNNGLGHGRGSLGTVRDTNTRFHAVISDPPGT